MTTDFIFYDDTKSHMVSSEGIVKDIFGNVIKPYISSTNILYVPFTFDGNITRLERLDLITAFEFNYVPDNLIESRLTVRHIDDDPFNVNSTNLEWIEDVEEWRTADFLKGYFVSSHGRIMSPHNGIISGTDHDGYVRIGINTNNDSSKREYYLVHRLVAQLFIGDIGDDDVNHIDGIKYHNYWDNLEIVPRSINNQHALMTGLRKTVMSGNILKMVDDLLVLFNGSPSKVLKALHDKGHTEITEAMISNRKQYLISEGMSFDVKFTRKFNSESLSLVKDLLVKYNGNVKLVFNDIKDKFPNISPKNIYSVREAISKEGLEFMNYRHNRKISENDRNELIKLLISNNGSPSQTYNVIKYYEKYRNVSVHDLKYLKRKYLS